MAKSRPQPTLADYMAIAISPALIMVLVSSLAFFLLVLFYAGAFEGKMHWTMSCFVFAAVLISRVSIIEGAERASMFGLALGVAVALAMVQYTNHPWGAWLVLGVIWWCASHLVWNCTLVDDDEDASGEGLLEAAGFATELADEPRAPLAPAAKISAAQRARKQQPQPPPAPPQPLWKRFFAWWQRSSVRGAPPGLTVVYFSLAALPIFGIGQKFIADPERQYAFQLMVRYVAAALGLLLTTSFLGLRRYLRQRRLEMPVEMAGTWLIAGGAMGVAIIVLALLIPRPQPEYAISSLTGMVGSPERKASDHAVLRNSPAEGQAAATAAPTDATPDGQTPANSGEQPADPAQPSRPGGQQTGKSDGVSTPPADGQQPAQGQESGGKASGGQGSQQQQSSAGGSSGDENKHSRPGEQNNSSGGQSANNKSQSADKQQTDGPQQSAGQQQKGAQGQQQSGAQQRDSSQQAQQSGGSGEKQQQQDQQSAPQDESQRESKSQMAKALAQHQDQQKSSSFRPPPMSAGGWFVWALKMLLYLVVIVVGIYCLIRYWRQILDWIARLWRELVDLWNSLFGRRSPASAGAEESAAAPRARPFASFQDPFVSGAARRSPPNAVVQYSFEALEAWAAEREQTRLVEETPLEFAARIAAAHPPLGEDVQEVASHYARIAYARETLGAESLAGAQRLWAGMRSAPAAAAAP